MSNETAVVIEDGSGLIKAGLFSDSESSQLVFPASIVGRSLMHRGQKDFYVGDEVQKKRGVLSLKYPIEHGIIKNWDDMEKLWTYTFSRARKVDSTSQKVMRTKSPQNPKSNRKKMIELMLKKFNVPPSYAAIQSVYTLGKTTGLVVDISHNVHRMSLGGRDIIERGHFFTSMAEKEIARDIEEKLSYTALDYCSPLDRVTKNDDMAGNYGLPEVIQGNSERSRCAEVLLQPHLIGMEVRDIANAAIRCDIDIRKDLYENIVLSGGNSTFPNIEQRFPMVSTLVEVDGIAPPERKFSMWIGGVIFTMLAILIIFSLILLQRNKYDKKWHLSHSIGQNKS